MVPIRLALVFVVFAALGCEREYGVYRRAALERYADLKCIRRVLDETQGIASVRESGNGESQPIRPDPRNHYYFYYEGTRVTAHLAVIVEGDMKVTFSQALVSVNERPPDEVIDSTRMVMRSVEQSLEAKCGIDGLAGAIREVCLGVTCSSEE